MDASSTAIVGVITEWWGPIRITHHWPNPSAAALAVSLILRTPFGFLEAKPTKFFCSTRKSTQDLLSVFPFTTSVICVIPKMSVQDGVQVQPVYKLLFAWHRNFPPFFESIGNTVALIWFGYLPRLFFSIDNCWLDCRCSLEIAGTKQD